MAKGTPAVSSLWAPAGGMKKMSYRGVIFEGTNLHPVLLKWSNFFFDGLGKISCLLPILSVKI